MGAKRPRDVDKGEENEGRELPLSETFYRRLHGRKRQEGYAGSAERDWTDFISERCSGNARVGMKLPCAMNYP